MNRNKFLIPKYFPLSGTIHEWLLASSGFSCLLLLGRMIATGSLEYIFLPWNLFLAFVPYFITIWMTRNVGIIENKIKFFLALAVWLLFIPNSFYIITDLVHFTRIRTAPKWFDILLIFSFAWNGILYGIISIRKVETITALFRGKQFSVFIVFGVMWLCAFGVYIGRFLRYNSWDIITDPFSLAGEILNMIIHPFVNEYAWGMTICYSVFMTLIYFTIKKLGETFIIVK
jgi:uncharacterized membrane protein